ncbi:MAG: protein DpdJ [Candidatus Competibacteraceae bacterium]
MAESVLDQLLFRIEEIECRSLIWGFVDGALSYDEVYQLAQEVAPNENPDDLVEDLIDRRLLFELSDRDGLRSRFAEGIRLLARLRQLFPNRPWQTAPRLVSDFRLDLRPRRYPDRDPNHRGRQPSAVLEDLQRVCSLSPLQRAIWQALTCPGGQELGLAVFQEEACRVLLTPGGRRGVIVTAGTGSGKTLAFYLPAFLQLAELLGDGGHWVKTLAIYPRTELLRDQLSECLRMARRVAGSLHAAGRRGLTIGALYQAIPYDASERALEQAGWTRFRNGDWLCPILLCPDTGDDLLWTQADRQAGCERLVRRQDRAVAVVQGELIFTRRRLLAQPPDVLFSTVEMLNRRLADTTLRRLFGIGQPVNRRPPLLLLDEVHTYTGTSGAHAAFVLRRWQHALNAPVTFVGLSATLLDAPQFFADLTGIDASRITLVEPRAEDMVEEAAEYQIILRGDPAARTSLLSTTIQTLMLLGRLLDPATGGRSQGRSGERVFAFTDDLDVINRLFDNFRDAEGYTIFGRRDPRRFPLAALRSVDAGPAAALRQADGQRWRLCEWLGHPLDTPLVVARTTSQDRGVDQAANVIVASAALEVGFNDPRVGAVVQHKAPRDWASFLQRKGRAGRHRTMRPWTVTVLSDYGRDRLYYQSYERLFEPVLPPQPLPIRNPYLLRMQAAMALLDWLTQDLPRGTGGNAWRHLATPEDANRKDAFVRHAIQVLGKVLLVESPEFTALRNHLLAALQLDEATVDEVLWSPPRSLLLEAIPTLLRRLYRRWQLAFPVAGIRLYDHYTDTPLPEFIPANLFSDLNLPEVTLHLPPPQQGADPQQEAMPLVQAMNQMAPGRVSRRFAYQRGALHHWIAIDPYRDRQDLPLDCYSSAREYVATVTDEQGEIPIFRPWTLQLEQLRLPQVLPTSNARLDWQSHLDHRGTPVAVSSSPRSRWAELVTDVSLYLNAYGGHAQVLRYARTAGASILLQNGGRTLSQVRFVQDDAPVAVGFGMSVDGLRFTFQLPTAQALAQVTLPPALQAACRTAYYRWLVLSDPQLPSTVTVFEREWLQRVFLATAIQALLTHNSPSLLDAARTLTDADFQAAFDALFTHQDVVAIPLAPEQDADLDDAPLDDSATTAATGAGDNRQQRHGRLTQQLQELLAQPTIRARLYAALEATGNPADVTRGLWLRRRLHETLTQACLLACQQVVATRAGTDTLLADPLPIAAEGPAISWITETTLGGAGILESLAAIITAEPRRLFRAVEAALQPSDLEWVSQALDRFVELACTEVDVATATARVRGVVRHTERADPMAQLFALLRSHRLPLGHATGVALNTRLLRHGMTPQDDVPSVNYFLTSVTIIF